MRPLIYGNGSLLVCVDERGIVRDFYYPHAGMENHGGYIRLGLFDAGRAEVRLAGGLGEDAGLQKALLSGRRG